MYTTYSDQARPTSDLAARLTDVGLEMLAGTGTRADSVETELRLWYTLRAELEREFRWRRFIPGREQAAPLDGVLRQLVHRAATRVAAEEYSIPEFHARRAERAGGCLCQV